jgi:hypothetical protein
MAGRPQEFTRETQRLALLRQQHRCASCGTPIADIGEAGRARHKFLEGAHAHHVKPVKFGGTNHVNNCVVICQSCHYSVHEGGNYRFGTVVGTPDDFPLYHGPILNRIAVTMAAREIASARLTKTPSRPTSVRSSRCARRDQFRFSSAAAGLGPRCLQALSKCVRNAFPEEPIHDKVLSHLVSRHVAVVKGLAYEVLFLRRRSPPLLSPWSKA